MRCTLVSITPHLLSASPGLLQGFIASASVERPGQQGAIRYVRDNNLLYLQWNDNRVISVLSTHNDGTAHIDVLRKRKVAGQMEDSTIKKPQAVNEYNQAVGGVDKFDAHVAAYCVLQRSKRWWHCLFLDVVDLACVSAYILFQKYRAAHPEAIVRPAHYEHLYFCKALTVNCRVARVW
eukprot:scpid69275/ scgid22491/ 